MDASSFFWLIPLAGVVIAGAAFSYTRRRDVNSAAHSITFWVVRVSGHATMTLANAGELPVLQVVVDRVYKHYRHRVADSPAVLKDAPLVIETEVPFNEEWLFEAFFNDSSGQRWRIDEQGKRTKVNDSMTW